MTNNTDKLNKLDDNKLVEVVKNYRQYGYSEELRKSAISILNDRGITLEQLQLTGNFENKTYNYANDLYNAFSKNSKIAFILYSVLLLSKLLAVILAYDNETLLFFTLIFNWVTFIGFCIYLVKSFINEHQFYKAINKDFGIEGFLLYIFLGMPLYIFMYFYFQKQMREKMNEIR